MLKTNLILGSFDEAAEKKNFDDFFKSFKEIQGDLGQNSFLLSSYFVLILKSVKSIRISSIILNAIEDFDLYLSVRKAIKKENGSTHSWIDSLAKDIIEKHPFPCSDDEVAAYVYILALLHKYLPSMLASFEDTLFPYFNDDVEIKELFEQLVSLTTLSKMTEFQGLMIKVFFRHQFYNLFIHGVYNQIYENLLLMDEKSRKYVFEIYLDIFVK